MNRKGSDISVSTIIYIVLGLIALAMLVFILYQRSTDVSDAYICGEKTGHFECRNDPPGCNEAAGETRYLRGIHGCTAGQICCQLAANAVTAGGACKEDKDCASGTCTDGKCTEVVRPVMPTIQILEKGSAKPLTEGQTLVVIPDQPETLIVSGSIPHAYNGVDWETDISIETTSGVEIHNDGTQLLVSGSGDTIEVESEHGLNDDTKHAFSSTRSFTFKEPLQDQKVRMAISIYPYESAVAKDTDDKKLENSLLKYPGTQKTYVLYFNVKPAVGYVGLTPTWSQRKQITAFCENKIKCGGIYYAIVANPNKRDPTATTTSAVAETVPSCPTPTDLKSSISLSAPGAVKYFIMKDQQAETTPYNSLQECYDALSARGDQNFGSALSGILAAAPKGTIPQNVALLYQQEESRVSAYSCQANLPEESWKDKFFAADLPATFATKPQTTIPLALPFMSEQYLCVYATDKNDPNRIYSAGTAKQIKIDTVPPVIGIKFKPWTLELEFTCTDNQSGCKEVWGTAYISDVTKFLSALVAKKTPMSAAVWCPAFTTATGYKTETKRQLIYTDQAVRVLCVRGEDNAGNAGVAMTTVYNGYDLLAKAIAEYQKHDS